MGLKAIDKSYENFQTGDVVVHNSYGNPYGVKLVKKVYLDTTNEYHFVAVEGEVVSGKWQDSKSGGVPILSIYTAKQLRGYTSKWTPGNTFDKPGTVLKDQDGTVYLVASDKKIWNLSKGTQTTQARWEAVGTNYGGRVFTEVKTASGDAFTTVVKVEEISSSW